MAVRRVVPLVLVGALALTSLAAPAMADRDDGHWRHDGHHRGWEGPPPVYYPLPRPYYPPPVVYAPPPPPAYYYAPPAGPYSATDGALSANRA